MPSRQKRLYERLSIDEKAVVIDEKFDDRPMVFIDEKVDDYHVFWRHLLDEKAGIDAKSSILVESFVTLDTKDTRTRVGLDTECGKCHQQGGYLLPRSH